MSRGEEVGGPAQATRDLSSTDTSARDRHEEKDWDKGQGTKDRGRVTSSERPRRKVVRSSARLTNAARRQKRSHTAPTRDLAAVDPCELRPDAAARDPARHDRDLRASVQLRARHVGRNRREGAPADSLEHSACRRPAWVASVGRVAAERPPDTRPRLRGVLCIRDHERRGRGRGRDGCQQHERTADEEQDAHQRRYVAGHRIRHAAAAGTPSTISRCL